MLDIHPDVSLFSSSEERILDFQLNPLHVKYTSPIGGLVGNLLYSRLNEDLFIIQSSFFLEKTAIPIPAIAVVIEKPGSDESSFSS